MKKMMAILLAIGLLASMAACTEPDEPKKTENPSPTVAGTVAPTPTEEATIAPTETPTEVVWPTTDIAGKLPTPSFTLVSVNETEDKLSATFSGCTAENVKDFENALTEKGFTASENTLNAETGVGSLTATNADGDTLVLVVAEDGTATLEFTIAVA